MSHRNSTTFINSASSSGTFAPSVVSPSPVPCIPFQPSSFTVHYNPASAPIDFGDPNLFLRQAWIDIPYNQVFHSQQERNPSAPELPPSLSPHVPSSASSGSSSSSAISSSFSLQLGARPLNFRVPVWIKQCICVPHALSTVVATALYFSPSSSPLAPSSSVAPHSSVVGVASSSSSSSSTAGQCNCLHRAPWEQVLQRTMPANRYLHSSDGMPPSSVSPLSAAAVAAAAGASSASAHNIEAIDYWARPWSSRIVVPSADQEGSSSTGSGGDARPYFTLCEWNTAARPLQQVLPIYHCLFQIERGCCLLLPDLGFSNLKQEFMHPMQWPNTYKEYSLTTSVYKSQFIHQLGRIIAAAAALCRSLHSWHLISVVQRNVRPIAIFWHEKNHSTMFHDFSHRHASSKEIAQLENVNEDTKANFDVKRAHWPYMSPEQTGRLGPLHIAIDVRSDVYSLGATMYELITGKPPFASSLNEHSMDPVGIIHAHLCVAPRHLFGNVPPSSSPAASSTPAFSTEIPIVLQIVDRIVQKCLSKTPDGRYQSALGCKYDLDYVNRLLQSPSAGGLRPLDPDDDLSHSDVEILRAPKFVVGKIDELSVPLLAPGRLFGREEQVSHIVSRFEALSSPQLLLVKGLSGVGKTSLVIEAARQCLDKRNGAVISAKYAPRFNRAYGAGGGWGSAVDTAAVSDPFNTRHGGSSDSVIFAAFQNLIRQKCFNEEAQSKTWRVKLQQALGSQAWMLMEVFPELQQLFRSTPSGSPTSSPIPSAASEYFISQHAPPMLPPHEAQQVFNSVFVRFVQVFASASHPLILFIDDAQWLDAISLHILHLLLGTQSLCIYIIGTCRTDEMRADHQLLRMIEALKARHATATQQIVAASSPGTVLTSPPSSGPTSQLVEEMEIGPLSESHLTEWLSDSFHEKELRALDVPFTTTTISPRSTQISLSIDSNSHQLTMTNSPSDACVTTGSDSNSLQALAHHLYSQSGGNSFFLRQLLCQYHDRHLIKFNFSSLRWEWNMETLQMDNLIRRMRTANTKSSEKVSASSSAASDDDENAYDTQTQVLSLLCDMVSKLGENLQDLLKKAACLGNRFTLGTMQIVLQLPEKEVSLMLSELISRDLIVYERSNQVGWSQQSKESSDTQLTNVSTRTPSSKENVCFRFLHDSVQQASYDLMNPDECERMHLNIGRILLAHTPESELPQRIHEIVDQINVAATNPALLSDVSEMKRVIELNVMAARKACVAISYESALNFLQLAVSLLKRLYPENPNYHWTVEYELSMVVFREVAEAGYLTNEMNDSSLEEYLAEAMQHAQNLSDRIALLQIRMNAESLKVHTRKNAIKTGLEILRLQGLDLDDRGGRLITSDPSKDEELRQPLDLNTFLSSAKGQEPEKLLLVGEMQDPVILPIMHTLAILSNMLAIDKGELHTQVTCVMLAYSFAKGVTIMTAMAGVNAAGFLRHNRQLDLSNAYGMVVKELIQRTKASMHNDKQIVATNILSSISPQTYRTPQPTVSTSSSKAALFRKVLGSYHTTVGCWSDTFYSSLDELSQTCAESLAVGDNDNYCALAYFVYGWRFLLGANRPKLLQDLRVSFQDLQNRHLTIGAARLQLLIRPLEAMVNEYHETFDFDGRTWTDDSFILEYVEPGLFRFRTLMTIANVSLAEGKFEEGRKRCEVALQFLPSTRGSGILPFYNFVYALILLNIAKGFSNHCETTTHTMTDTAGSSTEDRRHCAQELINENGTTIEQQVKLYLEENSGDTREDLTPTAPTIHAYLNTVKTLLYPFKVWAHHCPGNWLNRKRLIEAEICHLLIVKCGQRQLILEAMNAYDESIALSHTYAWTLEKALACEYAARFYRNIGRESEFASYLTRAFQLNIKIGYHSKVDKLAHEFPQLLVAKNLKNSVANGNTTLDEEHMVEAEQNRQKDKNYDTADASHSLLASLPPSPLASAAEDHPSGSNGKSSSSAFPSSGSSGIDIDIATLTRACNTFGGERNMDVLVEKIIWSLVQYAGVSRGVLLLPTKKNQSELKPMSSILAAARSNNSASPLDVSQEWRVSVSAQVEDSPQPLPKWLNDQANATFSSAIRVLNNSSLPISPNPNPFASIVPVTLIQCILSSSTQLTLTETEMAVLPFSQDEYFKRHIAKSCICAPVLSSRSQDVIGILYFEHHHSSNPFSAGMRRGLFLLCSQIALALENARQYAQVVSAMAEVERVSIAKSEFLATIGNEMRTPLLAMLEANRTAPTSTPSADQQSMIDSNGESLLSIVNGMAELSKVESERIQLQRAAFSLLNVVENAMSQCWNAAYAKHIDLTFQIDSKVPDILIGDCVHLAQMLTSIVSHAIKFASGGSLHLSVSSRILGATEELVAKHFPSISLESNPPPVSHTPIVEFLFELRHTPDRSNTDLQRAQGADVVGSSFVKGGLSLAVCQRLIERMSGQLLYAGSAASESNTNSEGTLFRFSMVSPISAASQVLLLRDAPLHHPILQRLNISVSVAQVFANMPVYLIGCAGRSKSAAMLQSLCESVGLCVRFWSSLQEFDSWLQRQSIDCSMTDAAIVPPCILIDAEFRSVVDQLVKLLEHYVHPYAGLVSLLPIREFDSRSVETSASAGDDVGESSSKKQKLSLTSSSSVSAATERSSSTSHSETSPMSVKIFYPYRFAKVLYSIARVLEPRIDARVFPDSDSQSIPQQPQQGTNARVSSDSTTTSTSAINGSTMTSPTSSSSSTRKRSAR